ncbi:MAG TPA: BadF/BadG/BcrA/BcrD ATPase family protein [Pyrinomonadaceae bacterium]|nr:BadF/BadG/BcrA/BcrD ATPase family protein [Pyrinomonadaceae bacterium]
MKKETKAHAYRFYLGVDGGGTKCTIAIMNDKGRIVAEATGGPANPLRVGVETAVSNIAYAIDKACDDQDISRGDIVAAALGLAGVRRYDIRERVRESFLARFRVERIFVTTDAEIALYGTTLGNAGLVVIAGTGSICLGVDSSGRRAMAGGWGPVAGDEGGGRGIAGEALHRIAKASDGRGPATALSEQAAEYFRASNVENLIGAIYAPTMDNSRIAGFSRLVTETAKAGDAVAIAILKDAGAELGNAAAAVIRKLKLRGSKFPVGCVGSVFLAGNLLTDTMTELIHAEAPRAFLTKPKFTPAHAACQIARTDGTVIEPLPGDDGPSLTKRGRRT